MDKSVTLDGVDGAIEAKLLRLIEEGDATVILSTEYIESLNELMKQELITIENEKLLLTEKGRQARIHGIKTTLEMHKPVEEKEKLSDFPVQKLSQSFSNRAFLYILFFFLITVLLFLNSSRI